MVDVRVVFSSPKHLKQANDKISLQTDNTVKCQY